MGWLLWLLEDRYEEERRRGPVGLATTKDRDPLFSTMMRDFDDESEIVVTVGARSFDDA